MIKKIYFIPIIILFVACTNELDNEDITNNISSQKPNVSIGLSLDIFSDTEFNPMLKSTNQQLKADEENSVKTFINDNFHCLVLKQIENLWIVDTLFTASFSGKQGYRHPIIDELPDHLIELILRPGHYRMTVVLNSTILPLNPEIVAGKIVNDGSPDQWPSLFSYPPQTTYKLWGDEFNLSQEIFAGMIEFDVEKQTELSSEPITLVKKTIPVSRRVGKFRFAIKDEPEETERINKLLDDDNQYQIERKMNHWIRYRLKAKEGNVFPSGLNVLGEAYYNLAKPLKEISGLDATTNNLIKSPSNNAEYIFATSYGSSCLSIYFFTDRNNPDPIEIEVTPDFFANGQAVYGNQFELDFSVNSKIEHNKINGVVFGITEDIYRDIDGSGMNIIKLRVIDEDISTLFPPYFEWQYGK